MTSLHFRFAVFCACVFAFTLAPSVEASPSHAALRDQVNHITSMVVTEEESVTLSSDRRNIRSLYRTYSDARTTLMAALSRFKATHNIAHEFEEIVEDNESSIEPITPVRSLQSATLSSERNGSTTSIRARLARSPQNNANTSVNQLQSTPSYTTLSNSDREYHVPERILKQKQKRKYRYSPMFMLKMR